MNTATHRAQWLHPSAPTVTQSRCPKAPGSSTSPAMSVARVGRQAGAEPRPSAAPDRRPIERSSKPHHLSTE